MKRANRGFIALISTIIIAAILLVMMSEAGMASFFARFDSLGNENRQQARALASSCIQVALLSLAASSSYAVSNQAIDVGTDENGNQESCTIQSIAHDDDGSVSIRAYAASRNSFVTLSVRASLSPITIISYDAL